MARIFSEGFETQHYTPFQTASGGISYTTGRTGGRGSYCLRMYNGVLQRDLGANYSELYVRFYHKFVQFQGGTTTHYPFVSYDSGGTGVFHLGLYYGGSLPLYAYQGATQLADITPYGWNYYAWTCYEIYIKNTSGERILTVKMDGAQVYTNTVAAGVGANNIRSIGTAIYHTGGGSTYIDYDDVAVNDASGSLNNSWCGNGSIVALVPTSTPTVGLTGSDGNQTDNHLLVDERAYDDDTTYVKSDVAAEDWYGLEDLAALASGESINCVWTSMRARKEGSSTLTVQAGISSNSNEALDTAVSPTTSYTNYEGAMRETDPNTSAAWTESGVNALLLGIAAV